MLRDPVINSTMKCQQLGNSNAQTQLTSNEGGLMSSMSSPLQQYMQQQRNSPDFGVNSIRPRTSSNASSIAGYDGESIQFRDRSASNASSCGGAIGVTGHLSPPSLRDYPETESPATCVSKSIVQFISANHGHNDI